VASEAGPIIVTKSGPKVREWAPENGQPRKRVDSDITLSPAEDGSKLDIDDIDSSVAQLVKSDVVEIGHIKYKLGNDLATFTKNLKKIKDGTYPSGMSPPSAKQLKSLREIDDILAKGNQVVNKARLRAYIIACGSSLMVALGGASLLYWALNESNDEDSDR
jgi:hypothetical protein